MSFYECGNCGAGFGIIGQGSGSPEDDAADEYYADEIERHESGACRPEPTPEPTPQPVTLASSILNREPAATVTPVGVAVSLEVNHAITSALEDVEAMRAVALYEHGEPAREAINALADSLTAVIHAARALPLSVLGAVGK